MITDKYILDNCLKKSGSLNPNKLTGEIQSYLQNRFTDIPKELFTFSEVIYRIKNNISTRPVCKICGKPVKFKTGKTPYATICSKNCVGELTRQRNIERWTNITDEKRLLIKEKTKQTCLQRYGCEYSFQSDNNKEKSKQTCLQKYGEEHYGTYGSKTFKQNMLNKFGYEHPQTAEIVREKISKALRSSETQNKLKQTNLVKYGCEYVSQNLEVKQKIQKSYKEHCSGNTSIQEQKLYEILIDIYPDTERFYYSDEYPFNCDYYIPSLRLYIELHASQFHNNHYYRNNEYDNNLLKSLTDDIVSTWTVRDVKKYETAVQNKLNYLLIYPKFHEKWKTYNYNTRCTDLYRKTVKDDIKKMLNKFIEENYNNKTNIQLIIGEDI